MSGVTDCYQPVERRLQLTRQCLEVMLEARQPVTIITKNALVTRDLDLLRPLAEQSLVHVAVSVTSLDDELLRQMEPRTSSSAARLRAIEQLTNAGVPVLVMVAPIIPGLTDAEIPRVLTAAREAGARSSGFQLLRLPLTVLPVFDRWLADHRPLQRERVLARIRDTRGGKLNDAHFGSRMRGRGPYAEQIAQTFRVFGRRLGLDQKLPPLDSSQFRPPRLPGGQMRMF